jgi:hypothetical protein
MAVADLALELVLRGIKNKGLNAYFCGSNALPDILIADEKLGLIAIDVFYGSELAGMSEDEKLRTKQRKRKNLRLEVEAFDKDTKIRYNFLTVPNLSESAQNAPKAMQINPSWLDSIEESPISEEVVFAVGERFNPAFTFVSPARVRLQEAEGSSSKRANFRYTLDSTQAAIARKENHEITLVTGPAGSGKTVILIARALYLAKQNPKWIIKIVCYNKSLKPYLQYHVRGNRNITVETFGELTRRIGYPFRMMETDESQAQRDWDNFSTRGEVEKRFDALLVDEVQDFYDAWLVFLNELVKPLRGGMMIAGDDNQAIYRESSIENVFPKGKVSIESLTIPYRSTKQILELVQVMLPEMEVPGIDEAPDGLVPDLIYVNGNSASAQQADALAQDIIFVMENFPEANFGDFGILCTRNYQVKAISGIIRSKLWKHFGEGVYTSPIFKGLGESLDMRRDTVKILTIHSAKGLEFRFVFLVGLQVLADGIEEIESKSGSEIDGQEAKLNLVGPTRAKDLLYLYYNTHNVFLRRLQGKTNLVNLRRYPDDYEVETNG